ncbi:MAG: sugar ABC transporter permease [candidate division KSB1 bacterium]|nr:sugar ABC transporter permease [candidate division KSB1 bacterium]
MTRRAPRGIYLALLPSFALLAVFNYWPIASALVHSVYRWDPGGTEDYVGTENFARLLGDTVVWKSFANLALVMVVNLTLKIAVPLVMATLIFHLAEERWRYLYRVLFVVPMVVPAMVVILLWQFIYADCGLLTRLLQELGLGQWVKGWLGSPQTALGSVIGVGFPFVSGFALLVFYAGLLNIPESALESARIEGAGWWYRFWRIELPLLMGQMRVIAVLTMIGTMQGYELFLILTRGGPGYATMVPGLWMYLCGFSFNEMGYACSIGVVLFAAMLGLTVLNLRFMKQEELT